MCFFVFANVRFWVPIHLNLLRVVGKHLVQCMLLATFTGSELWASCGRALSLKTLAGGLPFVKGEARERVNLLLLLLTRSPVVEYMGQKPINPLAQGCPFFFRSRLVSVRALRKISCITGFLLWKILPLLILTRLLHTT